MITMAWRSGTARYRALGEQPGAVRIGLPSVVARLPIGMTTLAILLAVHDSSGSFGFAASAAACFAAACGLTSPVRGRLVDRCGAAPVLVVTGTLQAAALAAVAWTAHGRGAEAGVLIAAAAAGALLPPVGPVVRAFWQRLPDPRVRQAAFSLDSLILQVIYYTAGPPLVTLLTAAYGPSAALYTAAALTVAGTLAVASADGIRRWPRSQGRPPLTVVLRAPGLPGVLAVVLVTAAAVSALEVAVTAFAVSRHAGDRSGLLLALLGTGSIIGGLFQGARSWRGSLVTQYQAWLAVLFVLVVPLFAAPGLIVLGILLILAGLAVAPAGSVQFGLTGTLAPEGTVTEAFTWLLSASQAGSALGSAAAGAVAQAHGARGALLVPAVLAAAGLGLSFPGRRRLRSFTRWPGTSG